MSWTSLVGHGLRLKMARRARLLADERHWQHATGQLQARALRRLLTTAANTRFGKAHGFNRVLAASDDDQLLAAYRKAVPIRDWYGFKDDITNMREDARPDVLWPGLVRHFAQTSGTTAGDKYIPVSRAMFASNKNASLDIFAHLMNRGLSLPAITSGRCLFLGGSSDLRPNRHGIVTADLSGLVTPLIRWPLSAIYSPGPQVALIDDWPRKIEAMARLTIDQDIRFVSGMPSWAGVLMQRVLDLAAERGRPAERITDLWKNLTVFVHGGVRYDPFKQRLGRLVTGSDDGDFPCRHELYPASEAFIAMQDRPGERGLRLLTDIGNFYEFVPIEETNDDGTVPEDAPAVTPAAAEPGGRYCVVLTTCAGLFRYSIGDVVEFEDVPAGNGSPGTGPARLRIVGRNRHFINAFGENIIVEHIENAVAALADARHEPAPPLTLGEFTAAPVYPSPGRPAGLELVIETHPECAPPPTDDSLAALSHRFDEALKAQNVDYTAKRRGAVGMAPPTVSPVPLGSFHRWMASVGKLGGQHKCPRCANHRQYADAVLQLAGHAPSDATEDAANGSRR